MDNMPREVVERMLHPWMVDWLVRKGVLGLVRWVYKYPARRVVMFRDGSKLAWTQDGVQWRRTMKLVVGRIKMGGSDRCPTCKMPRRKNARGNPVGHMWQVGRHVFCCRACFNENVLPLLPAGAELGNRDEKRPMPSYVRVP
jgi:hypothetical protein